MRRLRRFISVALVALVASGCSTHSSGHTPAPVTSTQSAQASHPFSVAFNTSPCFDRPWTRLLADKWAIRDAVTGRVIATNGRGYQSRCGFYIQYRLTTEDFGQYSQVFIYDPKQQLVGLNQSNAGEAGIYVDGPGGGPYTLSRNVVANGPLLIDCRDLPSTCQGQGSGSSPNPPITASYGTYTNPRFGFTTLWPSSFTAAPPPEDGDGQEWTYGNRTITFTVYGSGNVNNVNPQADLRVISRGIRVSYSNISDNVVTVSGYKGPTTIVYERDVVGSGSIDTLIWQYPARQRHVWQAANTMTALAFQPGDVRSAH